MRNTGKVAVTKVGKLKLSEISKGSRTNLTLSSIKVSDRRVLIGDIANYIDTDLEGNKIEIIPLVLNNQKVQDIYMIVFVGYLDNAQLPYPNYVPQSFGLYDNENDLIFCGNLSLSNFASRFIVGRIDLVNFATNSISNITGRGLYNDLLTVERIYQLLTTPVDGTEENSLYSIRSLNGTINKVGVRLGNENLYIGYDDIIDCFITL